jgi:hypothetical protein
MSHRDRYTNPVENLRSYVMVHGGIDRQERLIDVEWVEMKVKLADELIKDLTQLVNSYTPELSEQLNEILVKWRGL